MDNAGRGGRVAKYTAQSLLKAAGFTAEKVTGRSRTFDIIAWNYDEIIGLVIRTSRSKGISGFSSLVAELGKIVQKRKFPGEIQIWILQSHEWKRYKVLPGGALLCSGRLA
ncbi:MAG: hypothetical protein GXY48_13385 [Methanomicrobiales archaeon]|nr:hypothetical protein [Methanomicrobiales archaeon]